MQVFQQVLETEENYSHSNPAFAIETKFEQSCEVGECWHKQKEIN